MERAIADKVAKKQVGWFSFDRWEDLSQTQRTVYQAILDAIDQYVKDVNTVVGR